MNHRKIVITSLLLLLSQSALPFVRHTPTQQEKPKDEKPDPRFVQMAKLSERNQHDARYASRLKAKFANDPKTLNKARQMYENAKDKFDGWLTALGLAIVHKKEKEINNAEFRRLTAEADKVATDFEIFAERLTQVEEENPLTGESATATAFKREQKKEAAAVSNRSAEASAARGGPAAPIPGVIEVIVGIAFEVYKQHEAVKLAQRQALVDDMKKQISWKEWGQIQPDPDTEALPKPSPAAFESPAPSAQPSAKPSPKPPAKR